MSVADAFITPTISALSASFKVTGPLAALIYSVLPSTLSMVPLIPWVCCAEAVATANTVAKAAAVRIRIVLMSQSPKRGKRAGGEYTGEPRKRRGAGSRTGEIAHAYSARFCLKQVFRN